eukprot:289680-Amphidinium_carterae.2
MMVVCVVAVLFAFGSVRHWSTIRHVASSCQCDCTCTQSSDDHAKTRHRVRTCKDLIALALRYWMASVSRDELVTLCADRSTRRFSVCCSSANFRLPSGIAQRSAKGRKRETL